MAANRSDSCMADTLRKKRKTEGKIEHLVLIAGGHYGQTLVEDAPGFKAVKKLRKLFQGIWVARATGSVLTGLLGQCDLNFDIGWLAYSSSNGLLYASDTTHERLVSLALTRNGSSGVACDNADGRGSVWTLVEIDSCDSLGGAAYVEISRDGKWAFTASYGSGAIAVFPLTSDGKIGPPCDSKQPWPLAGFDDDALHDRQEAPHPHQIRLDPITQKWALACDLGADRVYVYAFDSHRGSLAGSVNSARHLMLPQGAGPRHLDFHPNGKYVYVLCELMGTIVVCGWEPESGTLTAKQTVTLLSPDVACSRAHHSGGCHVACTETHCYATCRTDNSIAVFKITPATGKLTCVQRLMTGGHCSRHFVLDESWTVLHLSHQDSQDVTSYRISGQAGGEGPPGTLVEPALGVLKLTGMCPVGLVTIPAPRSS